MKTKQYILEQPLGQNEILKVYQDKRKQKYNLSKIMRCSKSTTNLQ